MKSIEILSKPIADGPEEYLADDWTYSYTAPWHRRHWYESTITLVCNDEDRQARPMKAREDFRPTTNTLACLRQEQERHEFLSSQERENEAKTIR